MRTSIGVVGRWRNLQRFDLDAEPLTECITVEIPEVLWSYPVLLVCIVGRAVQFAFGEDV